MSNINRFLNSPTGDVFINNGTLDLSIDSLQITGLNPNYPMATDGKNNVISTSTISVPAGTLHVGSAPCTTVVQGGALIVS